MLSSDTREARKCQEDGANRGSEDVQVTQPRPKSPDARSNASETRSQHQGGYQQRNSNYNNFPNSYQRNRRGGAFPRGRGGRYQGIPSDYVGNHHLPYRGNYRQYSNYPGNFNSYPQVNQPPFNRERHYSEKSGRRSNIATLSPQQHVPQQSQPSQPPPRAAVPTEAVEIDGSNEVNTMRRYRAAGTAPTPSQTSPFKQAPKNSENGEKPAEEFNMSPALMMSPQFLCSEDLQRLYYANLQNSGAHLAFPFPMMPNSTAEFQQLGDYKKHMAGTESAFGSTNSLPTTPAMAANAVEKNKSRNSKDNGNDVPEDAVNMGHPSIQNRRFQSALHGLNPNGIDHKKVLEQAIPTSEEAAAAMAILSQQQKQNFFPPAGLAPYFAGGQPPFTPAMIAELVRRSEYGRQPFQRLGSKSSVTSDEGVTMEQKGNEKLMQKGAFPPEPSRQSSTSSVSDTRKITEHSAGKAVRNGEEGSQTRQPPSAAFLQRHGSASSENEAVSVSSVEDVTITTSTVGVSSGKSKRNGLKPPPPPTTILSPTGQYQVSHMDVLSEKIWHYHNKVAQTDEMLTRKLHLRDMLYAAISPVFPMCGLYVVGSSLNGFGNNSSDMDLCLMITNKELDQKNDAVVVLNMILTSLQHEKFVLTQKLILAKVPILRIKFDEPFADITVDLNANNSVAIKNTHLLCYYSSYDWRVRPLVSVVKEWAKRKGINDANKSSFTSYSLVLMVIHYLQCGTHPSVLPNLQKLHPDRFSNKCDVRLLNVTMELNQEAEEQSEEDTATLGELLIGFLDYYANKFDYDRDAISIRQGQKLERAVVARSKMHASNDTPPPSSSASSSSLHGGPSASNSQFQGAWRSQWRCVCIEEPFTNSNTAHSIYDEMVFGAIKEAFREAHQELQANHDLDRLLDCAPISVTIQASGAVVYAASYEGERPHSQLNHPSHHHNKMLPMSFIHHQQSMAPLSGGGQMKSRIGGGMGNNKNHHNHNGYMMSYNNRNGNGGGGQKYNNGGGGGGGGARTSRSSEDFQNPRGVNYHSKNVPFRETLAAKKGGADERNEKPEDNGSSTESAVAVSSTSSSSSSPKSERDTATVSPATTVSPVGSNVEQSPAESSP